MSTGGSIQEVTLKGRRFPVAADADPSRKLGSFENGISPNGDGSVRLIKKRVASKIDGLTLSIDDRKGDQEYLQELADSMELFDVTLTQANGYVYSGQMQITGEINVSLMNMTADITLEGSVGLVAQ